MVSQFGKIVLIVGVLLPLHALLSAEEKPPIGTIANTGITKRFCDKPADYFSGSELRKNFKKNVENRDHYWLQGHNKVEEALSYNLSKQRMFIYVPDNYDGGSGWGAYLYTSPGKSGDIKKQYKPVFKKHRMIYIAPHGTQNGSVMVRRMGLTLDALATARVKYNIAPDRIIVSGFSGGGTVATTLAIHFPETFMGLVNHSSQYYPFKGPNKISGLCSYISGYLKSRHIQEIAETGARWAFVTGSNDKNYEAVLGAPKAWKKEGLDAKLFDQPKMGHSLPNPEYLDKMLTWIEKKRVEEKCQVYSKLIQSRNLKRAIPETRRILRSTPEFWQLHKDAESTRKELVDYAEKQADKLMAEQPDDADALLKFLRRWEGVDVGKKIETQVEKLCKKEMTQLLANSPSPKELKAFLSRWEGVAPVAPVKEKFNQIGKKVLKKLEAKDTSPSRYRSFVKYWAGFSCTDPVIEKFDAAAKKELRSISSNDAGSAPALATFIEKCKGFPVAEKAKKRLEKVLRSKLAKIYKTTKRKDRAAKLRKFINRYPDTNTVENAERIYRQLTARQ